METEPFVLWIDNFCKLYRTRMINLGKDTLQKLLWTGIALKRFAFPEQVSDAVMRDASGVIIPACAANPFIYIPQLLELLKMMTQDAKGGYLQVLSKSLMLQWDARTVPLQPVVERMHPNLRPAVLAANDRMSHFYPLGLSRENIGSNVGLSKIMRKLYIERQMNEVLCARYTTFSVDVNIYDRILKVCSSCPHTI
jgi:hypothetical protein